MENKALYKDMKRILQEHAEQKAEIERLKGFLSTFETVIAEQKEDIEKRVEVLYPDFMKEYRRAQNDLKESLDREMELQKQVDELTDICLDCPYKLKFDEIEKASRKDTAKEIYGEIDNSDILVIQTQEYGEIEVVPMERLKEIIKSKGVEVE